VAERQGFDAFAKASFHWSRIAVHDQPEARVAFNKAYNSTRRARRWLVALARTGPRPTCRPPRPTGSTCTVPCGG
jgi:hypothetical protein